MSRGDAIALVDGTLVHACPEPTDALLTGLSHARAGAASLVTLYGGADLPEGALANSKDLVADRFPGVEVEALAGGQPLYVLIASVE